MYLFLAINKQGKTLDFMLSEQRGEAAATELFIRAIGNNGLPDKVVIDKRGSNAAGFLSQTSNLKEAIRLFWTDLKCYSFS